MHQIHLAAAHGFFERHFKFAISKVLDVHLAEFDTEIFTDFLAHIARSGTGENFDWMD